MSTPLFDSRLEGGAFRRSQSREGPQIFRTRLLQKHSSGIRTPVRSQPHRLACVEIVAENQLRHVAVHRTDSAPVSNDFSEYFASLIGEPVEAFKLSRSVSLKGREILNHHRTTRDDFLRFGTSAILQHRTEWSTCTVDNQNGYVTSERR